MKTISKTIFLLIASLALTIAAAPDAQGAPKAKSKASARPAARQVARKPAKAVAKAPRAVAKAPARKPASVPVSRAPVMREEQMVSVGGVQEGQKAIQVTGQSRNLSMMLVLKNEKDKINFVEVRRDFRKEIVGTQY